MALLPQNDIPVGTSIAVFFQFFGGAIFLGIAENIFVSKLTSSLHQYAPTLDAAAIVAAGATGLRKVVALEGGGEAGLKGGILAYNAAATSTFYLVAAGASVATLCAFGIEWRSVKMTPKVEEEGAS